MLIDTLYEFAITKLTRQGQITEISNQLLGYTNNGERVLCVKGILQEMNVMPTKREVPKSESMSTHYRNLGNQHFQKSADYEAWQYYNLSLLHADFSSDNYCLALANRSAVLYSLKKFKECLQDIKIIFSREYPEKLKEKLLKRETVCKECISKEVADEYNNKQTEINEFLEMKGTTHPQYVCASSKLDVVYNEVMGRHVIAKADIEPGEVVAKEEPYLTLLLSPQYLFTCGYCLSRSANLYPCPSCCFALYCSEVCRLTAWKEYHWIECAISPTLYDMQFSKLELLALRTVVKARSEHESWECFMNTVEEAESRINTEYHGHVNVDGKWIYQSKYYPAIHTLASNVDKRSISDIFLRAVTASVFLHLLIYHSDFLTDEDKADEKIVKFVAELLLHHLMTTPTNMHSITATIEDESGNYFDEGNVAGAPYAFLSLLNHSCAPNVVRSSKLGCATITLIAVRSIKKGMQIFDNYGFHHALMSLEPRRTSLKTQYKFTCECEACINDWPRYIELKPAQNSHPSTLKTKETLLNNENINRLQKGYLDTALRLFRPLCYLVSTFDISAPCVELSDCQESLKQCLVILQGIVPFGYKQPVDWSRIKPRI